MLSLSVDWNNRRRCADSVDPEAATALPTKRRFPASQMLPSDRCGCRSAPESGSCAVAPGADCHRHRRAAPSRREDSALHAGRRPGPDPAHGLEQLEPLACNVDEKLIRETADALVKTGMRDAGYRYVASTTACMANAMLTATSRPTPSASLPASLRSTTQTRKAGEFMIPGLGKLVKAQREARLGRNPATGESIKIAAKTTVKFRLSKAAKDAVVPPKE